MLKARLPPFPKLDEEDEIYDFQSFWNWFVTHERRFVQMLNIEYKGDNEFKSIFMSRLMEVWKECAFYVVRHENGVYEITFNISNQLRRVVTVEELITAAPDLKNWIFSAFTKPVADAEYKFVIDDFSFDSASVSFFSTEHADCPDMVDITVTYKNDDENYYDQAQSACLRFIQHIVGELEMLTQLDRLQIRPAETGDPELIPLAKLPAFLRWRQTEFVEKYKGVVYDKKEAPEDKYLMLESAPTSIGLVSIATVDRFAICWNETASYPWILTITLAYEKTEDGQPDEAMEAAINVFQQDLKKIADANEEYLFLLHDSYDNVVTTYFACNEFRDISWMVEDFLREYDEQFKLGYAINLDKYWSVVDAYRQVCLKM